MEEQELDIGKGTRQRNKNKIEEQEQCEELDEEDIEQNEEYR